MEVSGIVVNVQTVFAIHLHFSRLKKNILEKFLTHCSQGYNSWGTEQILFQIVFCVKNVLLLDIKAHQA